MLGDIVDITGYVESGNKCEMKTGFWDVVVQLDDVIMSKLGKWRSCHTGISNSAHQIRSTQGV